MKKKATPYSQNFKLPRIFRDDLEEIETIITHELKPKEYRIETDDYEYDNVKEIPEKIGIIKKLHIQTYSPYLNIDIHEHGTRLYAGDDGGLKVVGAVKKISDIVSKRERRLLSFMSDQMLIPAFILSVFSQLVTIGSDNPIVLKFRLLILLLLGVALVWFMVAFFVYFKVRPLIDMSYSKSKLSFLGRNKDQIILMIISLIIGILATEITRKVF